MAEKPELNLCETGKSTDKSKPESDDASIILFYSLFCASHHYKFYAPCTQQIHHTI